MAMEERKCQMSWSSKKSSRIQSRLCSRDSAGVFCQDRSGCHRAGWRPPPRPPRRPPAHLPGAEALEEEEEGKAPDHRGADDAEQGDELDALAAAELWDRPGQCVGRAGRAVPVPSLSLSLSLSHPCPCPPHRAPSTRAARRGGLSSHLHDDVEGEVEEQVADANGQQVGSEVIGADNEAVGSTGEAGTGSGISAAWGTVPTHPTVPRHAGRSGSAWGGWDDHSWRPVMLSPPEGAVPWRGGQQGRERWAGGQRGVRLCTYSDQLMMFPMTRSTIRSCTGEGGCEGLGGAQRCRGGLRGTSTHHVHGPAALPHAVRVQHVQDAPQDARVCRDSSGHTEGPPRCPPQRCPHSPSFQRPM